MRRQLIPAIVSMIVCTLVLGLGYPLLVTGIAQIGFADGANGSPLTVGGRVVGSSRLGQTFTEARYFHGRPSAAGAAARGARGGHASDLEQDGSAGSNLGPTNPELLAAVARRVAHYRAENGLAPGVKVPVDAVTASGSGLDPHISVANARLQAGRVARARGVSVATVLRLVGAHTAGRTLGFLGEPRINVLELNVALDAAEGP
jgi:K+-transporting ATPase ATPase C chain